ALAALRPLRLEDAAARGLEEAGETGAVAAAALERKGWLTEAVRPLEQRQVAGARRRHLDAVELSAEPIERDRDVPVFVGVDSDCHRPLHDLASRVEGRTGLGQGCVGQRTQASIRSP